MGHVVPDVQELRLAAVAREPAGAHHHPFALVDRAVLFLPRLHAVGGEQEVLVGGGLLAAVDDVDRGDQLLHRQRVGRAVGEILAGDPVMRRVEMRAGMLAELQPVPRPVGAVGVVVGDRVDLDRRRVLEGRRQLDQRRLLAERNREVHDLDASGKKQFRKFVPAYPSPPCAILPLAGTTPLKPSADTTPELCIRKYRPLKYRPIANGCCHPRANEARPEGPASRSSGPRIAHTARPRMTAKRSRGGQMDFDAVIVGAGHNALAAAIHLASRGWSVGVFERNDAAGGAVRTEEVTLPGFRHDLYAMNLEPLRRLALPRRARRGPPRAWARLRAGGALLRLADARRPLVRRLQGPCRRRSRGSRRFRMRMQRPGARCWTKFGADAPHIFALLGSPMTARALAPAVFEDVARQGDRLAASRRRG